MKNLASLITSRLNGPLPGPPAQFRMAPRSDEGVPDRNLPPDLARRSGVMLLLFDGITDPELVLTLRSNQLNQHSNQISLPGGRLERGEEIEDAALRETREEVGIDPSLITVLGFLTPLHVPVSGNIIHPVVGWLDHPPKLIPDHDEVAEAFTMPLNRLFDPTCLKQTRRNLHGTEYNIPYWDVHRIPLWGATAMILSEFCELVGDITP
ncbi:MAG: CoA pyrophosphatase [Rhodothermaceae bacterium]|nr:CoA pyrophosphatase [Rhodothermaceae bacterium]